ncbi:4Fe-4S dicluster domain-containing protein [Sulfurimonas aquatica]|uniref:Fumarate reductase iron-sulfur subunit n=1 Tax=Sulfurimonas aquatica TaxID=2672570 RepID=A0A975AXY7_9BACT|nr:2Fe-2S iron-sulfur cluster-binding protein [Sulfurimonas aquatica]QSZ40624.1 4Fe-4S dicluster domain-containing protein [Sulfurimonas aquatica]
MKISIKREDNIIKYELDLKDITLLEALNYIKSNLDNTLAFSSGCRSSVCGSCSMRVNEREELACNYKVQDGDSIEPLKNMSVIRDLVVDMDSAYKTNFKAKAWLNKLTQGVSLNHDDEKRNEVQSDCILCSACYSACPVYAVNGEFLGPFALTRVWKYVSDKRESDEKSKIDNVQSNGVWDCTLCNECTLVCPQDISSKADIEKLRAKSAGYGYMDPSFGSFGGGFGFDGSPSF